MGYLFYVAANKLSLIWLCRSRPGNVNRGFHLELHSDESFGFSEHDLVGVSHYWDLQTVIVGSTWRFLNIKYQISVSLIYIAHFKHRVIKTFLNEMSSNKRQYVLLFFSFKCVFLYYFISATYGCGGILIHSSSHHCFSSLIFSFLFKSIPRPW